MHSEIPIIQCPLDCLASFGEVWNGQYDWSGLDNLLGRHAVYSPVIVDIGANVGAFAIWARHRFPRASVSCFEPQPEIAGYLKNNVEHFAKVCCGAISIHRGVQVIEGRNRLCTSFYGIAVTGNIKTIHPSLACADANIVKIDCEGGEADIVENMGRIPEYLALEYHSDELRVRCEKALAGKMSLVGSSVLQPGIGILKFAKL